MQEEKKLNEKQQSSQDPRQSHSELSNTVISSKESSDRHENLSENRNTGNTPTIEKSLLLDSKSDTNRNDEQLNISKKRQFIDFGQNNSTLSEEFQSKKQKVVVLTDSESVNVTQQQNKDINTIEINPSNETQTVENKKITTQRSDKNISTSFQKNFQSHYSSNENDIFSFPIDDDLERYDRANSFNRIQI
jgi:hypothetical protein